jgi:transglutaminase-like putative cysteine protease
MARSEASAAVSVERFFQFSLLGLVASGYLAVAGSGYLDSATVILTAAGLLLRGLLIGGFVNFEISERAATLLAISYVGFFGIDYLLLSRDFLTATVHLVFFLAVMKILTARTSRDYLYTAAIAFLELLAAAILSVDFNFFLFLALYLLFAMAALTSGEIRRSMHKSAATARGGCERFHPRLALLSTLVTLGILALTGGLFFLLPRTADAAFSRFLSHRIYLPGFSNQVTLGEIGEIKTTSRPILHVAVFSREAPAGLKWRGAALTDFDGKRWSNPHPQNETIRVENGQADLRPPGPLRTGRRLNYHVELNAVDTNALFFAGTPEKLSLRQEFVTRNDTGGYRLARPPPPGFGYDAYSLLEDPPESAPAADPFTVLALEKRERYLQQPRLDPRIPELARAMAGPARTDLERARAVERHLRRDFGYTLELPDREVADPLADFLFTRKKGYCEYFASAMTIMLRTLGIPARLATGFQSGVYNPLSELWLVRASDAHTWVEAWIPGHGWTTFDPTPPDPNPQGFSLLTKLGLYVDAAQTFWQEWVVSYDLARQGTLSYRMELGARRLGIRWFDSLADLQTDWRTYVLVWLRRYGLEMLLAVILGAMVWMLGPPLIRLARVRRRVRLVRLGQASVGDATLLYQRMLHIVRRRGYQKPAWFTPAEFADSLPRPGLGSAVAEFTATYNEWRFGGRSSVAPRLSHLLDELERQER